MTLLTFWILGKAPYRGERHIVPLPTWGCEVVLNPST